MKTNPEKVRTERSQPPAPTARELSDEQLKLIVGGEGSATMRRPL